MTPRFFPTAIAFRAWLEAQHGRVTELWIGFYKKGSGRAEMTYPEAVDEALCYGWIDGIVRRIDATRYMHRFTPRKPGSIWSNVNVGHVARLTATGKMHPAGLAAFAARELGKTGIYSFESKTPPTLPPVYARRFRAHRKAWAFFTAQAPWYQRLVLHKIATSKQETTRERWLVRAITASAAGKRL